jgi:molybdopterin-containing oxidoreductase family membrane subunit
MYADKKLLNDLTPEIERTSRTGYFAFAIFLASFGLGIYALILQIDKGHIVTGMRDNVVWGFYIVNFIFFMGVSYSAISPPAAAWRRQEPNRRGPLQQYDGKSPSLSETRRERRKRSSE